MVVAATSSPSVSLPGPIKQGDSPLPLGAGFVDASGDPAGVTNKSETEGAGGTTGAGSLDPNAPMVVPDTDQQSGQMPIVLQIAFAMAISSLTVLMKVAKGDAQVILADALAKLRDAQSKSAIDKIHADEEMQRAEAAKQAEMFKESADKIAAAAHKHHGPGAKIQLAFQALGAAMAVTMGALLLATGVGAPLGALLVATAVATLIMLTDSAMKEGDKSHHLGIAGQADYALHHDEASAAKADMAFGIAMTGVTVLLAGAMFFTPAGLSSLAMSMSKLAAMASTISQLVSTGATLGGAATSVAEGTKNYQASKLEGEALEKKADAKDKQAAIEMLQDAIDQFLAFLQGIRNTYNKQMDAISEGLADKAKTLTHKFVG